MESGQGMDTEFNPGSQILKLYEWKDTNQSGKAPSTPENSDIDEEWGSFYYP